MTSCMETNRLKLRWFAPNDATDVQSFASNWNIARMTGDIPHPYPSELVEEWIATHDYVRETVRGFPFAIQIQETRLGWSSLQKKGAEFELSNVIGEQWWRNGFATEAAKRMVEFAFEELKTDVVFASHIVENVASARVLEKCGFRVLNSEKRYSTAHDRFVLLTKQVLQRNYYKSC